MDWQGARVGEGAPPPLGGRGKPEEQARAIVAQIVNFLPGRDPPSDQTLAQQAQQEGWVGSAEAEEEGRGGDQGDKAKDPPCRSPEQPKVHEAR